MRRQLGFTLIEIMVAMAVASFLLIGLFSIVQTTLTVSNSQTQLANLQDNERLAMTRIGDVIQQSGYFTGQLSNTIVAALPAATPTINSSTLSFVAGQAIVGTHATTVPQDSITVRYYAGSADNLVNCDGSSPVATGLYYNTFFISGGNLNCILTTTIGGTTTVGAAVTLVSGVYDMVIQYGVDTSTAHSTNTTLTYTSYTNPVDTYFSASSMPVADWAGVLSVRVSLVFNNPLYIASGAQLPYIQLSRIVDVMNHT